MGIEFHCSQCQKLIKAPDSAGGKRGKCPHCGHSAYIPLPPDEREEISIAPISAEDERRDQELKRESTAFAATIGHATAVPSEPEPAGDEEPADLDREIHLFIMAMHKSRLEDAEEVVKQVKSHGKQARSQLQDMASKDDAPSVEGVPPPLAQAFVKNLLERIG